MSSLSTAAGLVALAEGKRPVDDDRLQDELDIDDREVDALRRGYVTEALNAGQPRDITADRVDMTTEVLDKHYDYATKEEKMERREDYLVDV